MLPAYDMGYVLIYLSEDNYVLCVECASKENLPVTSRPNYDYENVSCEVCRKSMKNEKQA